MKPKLMQLAYRPISFGQIPRSMHLLVGPHSRPPEMAWGRLGTAIRSVQTASESPRLTRFSLHAPKSVEVEFNNGSAYSLSAEYLRVYSPAVDSKIRSIRGEKVIFGRRHVGIMSAEPVGNYGVRLLFDDLHKTGIFTWDYFHHLGANKFSLMKNYIKTLKKHGLTRDPTRKK